MNDNETDGTTNAIRVLVVDDEETLALTRTMIESGEICDGKTIMLLQYAALHVFARNDK